MVVLMAAGDAAVAGEPGRWVGRAARCLPRQALFRAADPTGWLMLHRRLARDYETLPARPEAVIHLAMTGLMARRLTGENAISWRDPTSETNSRSRDKTLGENDL